MENKQKRENRARRHKRVRATVKGTSDRPRISVFKSNKNVFVQFIDDASGRTLLSNKTGKAKTKKTKANKTDKAMQIGEMLASDAKKMSIQEVVFDRGGFKYHGRIKAVADGLRKGGIKF